MSTLTFTDVQRLNYSILSSIRDAARTDLARASCQFGLDKRCLEAIGELSPDAVLDFVMTMGNEALFAPRTDLGSLLTAPVAVRPMLASAWHRTRAHETELAAH